MSTAENISPEENRAATEELAGSRLAHALVDLTKAPMTTSALGDVLSEISVICQAAFWEPVAVSISLGEPVSPTLVATASKLAQSLDGAQLIAGEGPLHVAWERRSIASTSDLRHDRRWPRLMLRLEDSPVCAAIAAPIETNESVVGALSVYSVFPELVNDAALETVELLAGAVAAVTHVVQEKQRLETVTAQLEQALQSRATIDQAKGILMARHHCDAEQAFGLLVEASSSANVKLREVAHRLVRETVDGG